MRFLFENADTPLVMFGCMASANCERCLVKRIKRRGEEKGTQTMTPLDFSDGTWRVSRIDSIVALEVLSAAGDVIAFESVDATTGNLAAAEIWCIRLAQGNGHSEIELREVSMAAPQLFPPVTGPRSYLTWIRLALTLLIVAFAALAYRSRR